MMHFNNQQIRLMKSQGNLGPNCRPKDTRWYSERGAQLFDPEMNELNGKKINVYTPKEKFIDLANFY